MPECLHAKYVDTLMKQVTPHSYDALGVSDEKAATQKALGLKRTPTVSISLKRLGGKYVKWLFSLSEWIQTTRKKGPILNENYHFFKKTSYMEIYSMIRLRTAPAV